MTPTSNSAAIKKMSRALALFRTSMDESIPLQLVHTFLLAAAHEGKGVIELAELVGTNKSTISRHLLDLADRLRNGSEGYGLLRRMADPTNLRSIQYKLTPKGQLVLNQLTEIMEA